MKKFILFAILLQAICFNKAFAQIGIGNDTLARLFNAYDMIPPVDDERYFTFPEGTYTHTQIMNIPESNESINVSPLFGAFTIPTGDHCILNAPTVHISGQFECPLGSSLEILNEGCQQNCDE